MTFSFRHTVAPVFKMSKVADSANVLSGYLRLLQKIAVTYNVKKIERVNGLDLYSLRFSVNCHS